MSKLYQAASALIIAYLVFLTGHVSGSGTARVLCERENTEAAQAAAAAARKAAEQNIKVVTEYVERVQEVEVRVPVVHERIVRLCEQPAGGDLQVPRAPGAADGGAAADPPDRRVDLAGELQACRLNQEKLTALQRWVAINSQKD